MPKPPPDYDAEELRAWRRNVQEVENRLKKSEKNLLKRIELFALRFEYGAKVISEKIREDPMFAAHFAKEPRRTGLHEKMAAEWLQNLEQVNEFEVLKKSGKDALYITSDGEIRKGMKNPPSKSLDFRWRTGNTTIYASHKYTRESGGNQDSQYKEMEKLLRQFQSSSEEACVLLVIVDGPYYKDKKMADLRNNTRSHPPQSYVTHIEGVPDILNDYVE
ncbi:MAG: hypothetical protein OXC38_06000 [Gammaproteobacteria bacterium]|nr:hypothetical protein [Gammaproteobacteria bacterium]